MGEPDVATRIEADEERAGAVARVMAFLVERFPPAPQVVLMVVLFVAGVCMASVAVAPALDVELGAVRWGALAAGLAGSLLFVVRLRVYDDVKDADTDRVENPERPIPRGLVSVRELDVAGAVILAVEGVLFAQVGMTVLLLWAIAAAWSVLMRVEFFVGEWLEARVTTYAVSHMVVMGLIFGALLAIGIEARGGSVAVIDVFTTRETVIAMLAATVVGIGFEFGRKFERYHAAHGEFGWSLWLLWPSVGVMLFTYLARDAYPRWTTLVLLVVAMATITGHALVMGQRPRAAQPGAAAPPPTGPLAAAVEAAPGLAGLLCYLVLAVAGVMEVPW